MKHSSIHRRDCPCSSCNPPGPDQAGPELAYTIVGGFLGLAFVALAAVVKFGPALLAALSL